MRTMALSRALVIPVCAWLLLMPGCLGSSVGPLKPVRPVCGTCEGEDRYVRLEIPGPDAAAERAPRFAHPLTLSPEDWKTVLGALRVQRHGYALLALFANKNPIEPVFTEDEIAYLSRALSQAFAQATAKEWVVFAVTQPQTPEVQAITSGAWFAMGGRVHLRLANSRFSVAMDSARELIWDHPTRIAVRDDFELVAGDFQQVLVPEPAAIVSFGRRAPYEVSVDYRALLLAAAAPPSASQKPVPTAQPPPSPPSTGSSPPAPPGVEGRLRALERLKEQGLVTEEEYRAKRKQILEQF